jgi:hypothetical protein
LLKAGDLLASHLEGYNDSMSRFSLRTLLLATMGVAMILQLLVSRGMNATVAHLLLVCAFALPGGSFGYDIGRTSRSAAIGTSLAAILGTLMISAAVLLIDYVTLL